MTEPKPTEPPSTGLAEGRWLWRRLYVFATSVGAWLILDRLLGRVPEADTPALARALMALLALTLVLYLVAPTAQQLTETLAALRLRLFEARG